jgi:hypothetical protein
MTITTQILLTLFATLTPTEAEVTDLCDVVHSDTSTPIRCQPHSEGAPRYGNTVCCDTQACFEAPEGYCLDDEKPFYCELGEVDTSGEVSCYFEVPDYCDVFSCVPGFQSLPQANPMCCYEGICWNIFGDGYDCEIQDIYWCNDGVTNDDGTVTCFD